MFNTLKRLHLGKIVLVTVTVVLGGSAVAAGATTAARASKGHHDGPLGVVTSVNGVSTDGTCGVSGAIGTFTLVGKRLSIVTVDVTTTTTFKDPADPTPSFADVCVGGHVKAFGMFSSGTLTAASVSVPATKVQGVVTSVNGVSTAGTCGVSGAMGTFTLVGKHLSILTVDVTTTTTFKDPADPTPSFADVCVGGNLKAHGTFSSPTLTAISVSVSVMDPGHGDHHGHGHGGHHGHHGHHG